MPALPDINMPYVAPAWRKVDGLPPDPSAKLPAARASHVPVDGAYQMSFLRAACAILPGDFEGTIRQVERPEFTRAMMEPHIQRYRSLRFNTSETDNFNCMLKELITHHDYLVDQYNYALNSQILWMVEPANETLDGQYYRFLAASNFQIAKWDASRRLDAMFENCKKRVYKYMEGDVAAGEIWRLDKIHQKLKVEPEVDTRSSNFVHEPPPPKLRFSEMQAETKYVSYTVSYTRTWLTPSRRAFLRGHWPDFKLVTYWSFRNTFDIKATFRNPIMNRFGQEFFVRQAESAWSNYLSRQLYPIELTRPENRAAFLNDMSNFPREYNALVENDPAFGPDYCVKDISLLMVPRNSILGRRSAGRG